MSSAVERLGLASMFLLWTTSHCAPATTPEAQPVDAFQFMRQFGYLEPGGTDSEALYTEDAITDAVKLVQKFGGLEQTGKLDNDTITLMKSRRCGVPDVVRKERTRAKRFVIGSQGWNKRQITYVVANWSPKIGEKAVYSEIQRALDAWGKYGRLSFRPVQGPEADIVVAFGRGHHGDGYPFDGPGSVLAHAFFPYDMGSLGGDIHFDEDEDWKINPGQFDNGVDFFTVAVHELGHSLGLAHSPDSESIMYPYYKGHESSSFHLGYDDILAMYQLYITRELKDNAIREDNGATTTTVHTNKPDGGVNRGDDRHSGKVNPDDRQRKTTAPQPRNTPRTPLATSPYPPVTFVGDDETVDDHKRHDDKHRIPTPSPPLHEPTQPDICDGSYDTVAYIRGELFVFKNGFVWRYSGPGKLLQGYPVPTHRFFHKLPDSVQRIDAVYQRDTDSSIIIFSGSQYWIFNGLQFIEGSPKPITDFGLPINAQKVDAAMVWAKNGKTYVISGDKYWRYDEIARRVDTGYPRSLSRFRGVPSNLDSATTWSDGVTYFFKDKLYWQFNNTAIRVDNEYPQSATKYWNGCPH